MMDIFQHSPRKVINRTARFRLAFVDHMHVLYSSSIRRHIYFRAKHGITRVLLTNAHRSMSGAITICIVCTDDVFSFPGLICRIFYTVWISTLLVAN